MTFRLIMQPAMAVLLAIRAGLRDAREGQPAFLWTVFSHPDRRHELLRRAWGDVGNVFILALVLDSIYQVMVHSGIYPVELLLTATILAVVPYAIIRGPVTRLARRQSAVNRADERHSNRATLAADPRQERQED